MRGLLFALTLLLPASAFAEGIMIHNGYVRASGPMARAGAAFMVIHNHADKDAVLIGAETDAARTVELHTHIIEDDIAKMREIEDGITIPAGGSHALKRGADHVMLMGLTGKLEQDDMVSIKFIFEELDPVTIELPVDNERMPEDAQGEMDHSKHN